MNIVTKAGLERVWANCKAYFAKSLSISGNAVTLKDANGNALSSITIPSTNVTATSSGSGNAVTSVTASGGAITVTKGTTFLTSHQDLSGKQDVISDLDTIRSGAALGATSLQSHQDISGKINTTGSRGALAGYETASTINNDVPTITSTSQDAMIITNSVITVSEGAPNTSWTKVITVFESDVVNLGSSWSWVGGSVPTLSTGNILVLCWCGDYGYAGVLSAS